MRENANELISADEIGPMKFLHLDFRGKFSLEEIDQKLLGNIN